MKKIVMLTIVAILCLTSVLAFTACTPTDNVLYVATNAEFAPFEYVDKDGTLIGIDIELAYEIGKIMGYKVVISDMPFTSVLTALETGSANIAMAGLTISEERLEKVDFCTPYFTANQVVIAKNGSAIANAANTEELLTLLENKKIGFQSGTVAEFFVEGDEGWGFDGIAGADALGFKSGSLAVQALLTGGVDCVIIDQIPAQRLVQNNADKLTVLGDMPLTEEEYAFAIQKGDTAMQTAVNNALKQLMDNGKFDQIVDKYYGK